MEEEGQVRLVIFQINFLFLPEEMKCLAKSQKY